MEFQIVFSPVDKQTFENKNEQRLQNKSHLGIGLVMPRYDWPASAFSPLVSMLAIFLPAHQLALRIFPASQSKCRRCFTKLILRWVYSLLFTDINGLYQHVSFYVPQNKPASTRERRAGRRGCCSTFGKCVRATSCSEIKKKGLKEKPSNVVPPSSSSTSVRERQTPPGTYPYSRHDRKRHSLTCFISLCCLQREIIFCRTVLPKV